MKQPEPMTTAQALTIAQLFFEAESQEARQRRVITWASEAAQVAKVLRQLRDEMKPGEAQVNPTACHR